MLICLEASLADAAETRLDGRACAPSRGYDETRPAPADRADARPRARRGGGRYERVGLELLARHAGGRPDGRRADDLHAAPGSTPGPGAADATPLLAARARAQDARRRSSGCGSRTRSAPPRWSTCARELRPGMTREPGGGDLAGVRPRRGHRLAAAGSRSRSASRSSGRGPGSGPSPRPATGPSAPTSRPCSRSGSAPTATGATTRSSSAPASCAPTTASSSRALLEVYGARDRPLPARREPRRARPARPRRASPQLGYPGQPSPPDLPRRRRPRPRAALRPPGRRRRGRGGDGARDRAGLLLGGRRRPAGRGQLPDHARRAPRSSPRFPDGVVAAR